MQISRQKNTDSSIDGSMDLSAFLLFKLKYFFVVLVLFICRLNNVNNEQFKYGDANRRVYLCHCFELGFVEYILNIIT